MVNKYVNLGITGGTGTEGNPWGYDTFATDLATNYDPLDDITYNLYNSHTYADVMPIQPKGGRAVNIITKPDVNAPARIKCSGTASSGIFDVLGPEVHTFERLSLMSSSTKGCIRNRQPSLLTINNCFLIGSLPSAGEDIPPIRASGLITHFASGGSVLLRVTGCTFVSLQDDSPTSAAFQAAINTDNNTGGSGTKNIIIDNCHFEGWCQYGIYVVQSTLTTGSYKYCSFFKGQISGRSPDIETISGGTSPLSPGLGNVGDATGTSQLPSNAYTVDMLSMTFPDDLLPGASIQGVGDPASGLTVDLVNTSRKATPDIGCIEIAGANPIISFDPVPQRDSSSVISTLDRTTLISLTSTDPYIDNTAEINRVDLYYKHTSTLDGTVGNRQSKRITYLTPAFSSTVSWSTNAKDGTWKQDRLIIKDADGASRTLIGGTDFTSVNLILS